MNDIEKKKKRILIAEDDPVSRRMLESLLLNWGCNVTVVTDGMEAFRVVDRADPPRLAILDWMMPGMEGVQICQRIRERPAVPIFTCSG
jgi:hypothetical protein